MNDTNNALILNNILLSITGYGTNIREDILLEQIISKGFIFDKKIKHCLGVAGECHLNSTYLWNNNKDIYQLCTGFALFDNVWYCHSWLIDKRDDTIIETNPTKYQMYFGYMMSDEDAEWLYMFLWKGFI